uniref:BTB domain-containing protein n=1 Tax=Panagrolaimus sp. JU765 TaxID=591449 RepID=A0AC34Q3V6_9BILA
MGFDVIHKPQITVPEDAITDVDGFTSVKERVCVSNDYWFYFSCIEEDGIVTISLNLNYPLTLHYEIIVNSIKKKSIGKVKDFKQEKFIFGKRIDLFHGGYMKIDALLRFQFDDFEIRHVNNELSHGKTLLEHEESKDFTICVGGQEIKVHKNILAVASPVFAAMLKPHCKEFEEGKVIIKDFHFKTVQAGVNIMYKHKSDEKLSLETLLNLYKFADKYDLVNKNQVAALLDEKLNLETLDEILMFSKKNMLDKLYEKCVNFFRVDFEKNCRKMVDFEDLDSDFIKDVTTKKYRRAQTCIETVKYLMSSDEEGSE